MLPEGISLLHGPGCPVCVTAAEIIDLAIELSLQHRAILCTFGDMLRVPGSEGDLMQARARGGDVRVVYSPLDSVRIATDNPEHEVVFFAIGFETTAPANALAVLQAREKRLHNFSILSSQVLVPPAIETILSAEGNNVHAFLAAGHVCTVTGYADYEPIAAAYGVPIVVTGFEPYDLFQGLEMVLSCLEEGRAAVENQYKRAVKRKGNTAARQLIDRVFQTVDRNWRGLGMIPNSGLDLRPEYSDQNAVLKFRLSDRRPITQSPCIGGEVLRGKKKPSNCPAYGRECTPERPLGAPMVSAEGACAAYYNYRGRSDS
jgi:hydrogenase expression/formation protein HypD